MKDSGLVTVFVVCCVGCAVRHVLTASPVSRRSKITHNTVCCSLVRYFIVTCDRRLDSETQRPAQSSSLGFSRGQERSPARFPRQGCSPKLQTCVTSPR